MSGKLTLEADLRGNEGFTGKDLEMTVNSLTNLQTATSAFGAFFFIKHFLRSHCFHSVSQRVAFLFKHKYKVVVSGAQTFAILLPGMLSAMCMHC